MHYGLVIFGKLQIEGETNGRRKQTVQPQSLKPHEDHQVKSLVFAKRYLHAYGYLNDDQDDDVELGIRKFQEFYRLNVSGKLDLETIKAMARPRCGVPDHHHVSSTSLVNDSKYAFFQGNPTWPPSKRSLTYSIDTTNNVVSIDDLRQAFIRAFGQWTIVTDSKFTFKEVPIGSDIVIGFYSRDHGDNNPFDGRGGVLAHAFAPTDGRMHLDADEPWSVAVPTPAGSVDLVSVGVHEAGHHLGLHHSQDPNAVMHAFLGIGENKRILNLDDIAGIQAPYPN
ncbi:metalloendoproteinase 5-MMP-like [Prosopis cineraria]|uniref:metalloendoproteinase 5-MMP-like n=1 Tax=Prosopis cineraria TaxID=364024 RepID=UPI0024104E18|nr:metalloendoproteinase 5-MMP-like [Prosopis cineraria]